METKIEYKGEKIPYTLIRKKIRNSYIQIKEGQVYVKVPMHLSDNNIQQMLQEKKEWIYQKLQQYRPKENGARIYEEGARFYYLGEEYYLTIQKDEYSKIEFNPHTHQFVVGIEETERTKENTQQILEKKIEAFYQKRAKIEIGKIVEEMSNRTNLIPDCIKVKRFKSVWGNCSSKRVISLNDKLVEYPKIAIEYVVLHELCHLKHMNHSKAFWNLVSYYMPNYKEVRKLLK